MRRRVVSTLMTGLAALLCLAALGATRAQAAGGPPPSADPFYGWSGSLSGVAPGSVLRSRAVSLGEAGITVPYTAMQVLYRSTGELGQPALAVATIVRPLLSGDQSANKLVSYQEAYDGLAGQCDPSYTIQGNTSPGYEVPEVENVTLESAVALGYTVVVPDYEQTTDAFLSGRQEGYGVLDGIRAAESFLGLGESTTPVGLVGYSGGSVASQYAAELAPSYAPALDLVATAIGGIPVDIAHTLAYINGTQNWGGAIPAAIAGIARGQNLDLATYLNNYGQTLVGEAEQGCLNQYQVKGLTVQDILKPQYRDYTQVPALVKLLNTQIMGTDGTPRTPMYMAVGDADGVGDGVMIAGDVEGLAHEYCGRGVSVRLQILEGANHALGAIEFLPYALDFLSSHLNGLSTPENCASIGTGNSLAPLALPASGTPAGEPAKPKSQTKHAKKHAKASKHQKKSKPSKGRRTQAKRSKTRGTAARHHH